MIAMKYTAIVTVLALAYTFLLSGKAGAMRGKHGIKAPAVTGHIEFEKAFRVHANTVEQLVLFLPLLWLAAPVVGDLWAAAVGAVWLAGRAHYATAYMADPDSRGPGMVITIASTGILAIITVVGIVRAFL